MDELEPDGPTPTEADLVSAPGEAWRDRLRSTARRQGARALQLARDERVRKGVAWAAGAAATVAVAAVDQHLRSRTPTAAEAERRLEEAAPRSVPADPASSPAGFYPTPERTLVLGTPNAFFEFPHPEIQALVIGVGPGGDDEHLLIVRWSPALPQAVTIPESGLSATWRRPLDRVPQVPIEVRLQAPGVVGYRFLDPGDRATGVSKQPMRQRPAKITAEQRKSIAATRHHDRMAVINRTKP